MLSKIYVQYTQIHIKISCKDIFEIIIFEGISSETLRFIFGKRQPWILAKYHGLPEYLVTTQSTIYFYNYFRVGLI